MWLPYSRTGVTCRHVPVMKVWILDTSTGTWLMTASSFFFSLFFSPSTGWPRCGRNTMSPLLSVSNDVECFYVVQVLCYVVDPYLIKTWPTSYTWYVTMQGPCWKLVFHSGCHDRNTWVVFSVLCLRLVCDCLRLGWRFGVAVTRWSRST